MPDDKSSRDSPRGTISPQDRDAFKSRASELARRLDAASQRHQPVVHDRSGDRGAAMGQAFKIAVELVAGIVFGFVVGWGLDRFFETSGPWFLIVFILLGFAAGMSNVIRTAVRLQAKSAPLQHSAPSVADDDEEDR